MVHVENGEIPRINLDRNFLTLARIEFHLTPPYQTLRWFSCTGWQHRVHLGNLRARPRAGIRQMETQLDTFTRSHLQTRITIARVREPITEGEQHIFPFRVIPLVTNLESLVITDLKGGQALCDLLPGIWIPALGR